MNKNLGMIGSSVDPSKIAATVQGIIISLSAVIVLLAPHFGITVGDGDVQAFASQIGLIVGAGVMVYGLIRKLIVWVSVKLSKPDTEIVG